MDHSLSTDVVTDGLTPYEVALSPNGRHLAYTLASLTRTTPRPVNTLWVADIDGTAPRPLTDGTFAVNRPRWSPEGRLYFLTDRTDPLTRRAHQPPLAPGLHRIEADGTGHRVLTDPRTTVVDHQPLPDQATVALVVADPEPPDDAPHEWGRHRPHDRLALLDLAGGTMRTITGLGERHVLHIAARPDGAHLAVITHPTREHDPVHPDWQLHLVAPVSGQVDHLGELGWEAHAPSWRHDGHRWHLSYLAMRPGPDGAQAVLDLIPGAGVEPTDLTADLERCPLELVQAAQGPPLALFAHGLDTELHRLDPSTRTFTPLRRSTGLMESLSCDDTGTTVAVQSATPDHPREVYAGPATAALTRLTHLRPALEGLTWVLIAHGREDTNVPVGQAFYLHRALRHFGVECEFVTYPGAGHGLHTPSHQADLLERTRAWFDRHLRPRA